MESFFSNIGTRGGNIGEFSYPISLAVLASGRIVVTDMGNNRIQIFEQTIITIKIDKLDFRISNIYS